MGGGVLYGWVIRQKRGQQWNRRSSFWQTREWRLFASFGCQRQQLSRNQGLPGTTPQVRLPHFRLRGPPKPCSLFEVNRPDRILLARLAATLGQNIEGLFRLLRERFESNLFQLESLIHHPAPSLDLQEQETTCFDLVESPVQFGDILDRGTVDIFGLDIVACRCDADELGGHDYSVRSLRRGRKHFRHTLLFQFLKTRMPSSRRGSVNDSIHGSRE
jgi:hypothetical protein